MGDEVCERLREAACVGDLDLVDKLQRQGADINSKNATNEWTALHWACKRNHVPVVHYLLENGADRSIANKDGHFPAQLSSNEEIRQMLGATADMEVIQTSLPITPNYLANPPFPYAAKDIDKKDPSGYSTPFHGTTVHSNCNGLSSNDELVLKARLANSDEKDFIEIELDRPSITFSNLLNLMCAELGVDKNLVAKIRKLPDTIVRKDKDVKRLTNFQEMELVLTNKAMSAASRTYSIGPARNNETILY